MLPERTFGKVRGARCRRTESVQQRSTEQRDSEAGRLTLYDCADRSG